MKALNLVVSLGNLLPVSALITRAVIQSHMAVPEAAKVGSLDANKFLCFPTHRSQPFYFNKPFSGSYLDAKPASLPDKTSSQRLKARAFNWSCLWMAALDLEGLVLALSSLLTVRVPGIWPCHSEGLFMPLLCNGVPAVATAVSYFVLFIDYFLDD